MDDVIFLAFSEKMLLGARIQVILAHIAWKEAVRAILSNILWKMVVASAKIF
jgi:hypothetical protein